jgi:Tfp pilus assembly protein PilF
MDMQAIDLDETYVKAYLKRATIYTATEKFEEAVRDHEAASKLDPSNHGMES